ncbi:polysaccharide deacetylase family protein [Paenarthrobacter sp. YJN-5]|uniref:polysaccharide deacetylase family protein n=1 Tax=Paenarthrobacter sp. YJN-5 TaxID=2735316 RepID=UPI0018789C17|nr:polysaccharide deacetylase family protein [Paenarthrobacter sp. YJN-5]QOT16041.1 polysaccharide deacetylase family protein [Paenarthrobacter sp. YJN-5]
MDADILAMHAAGHEIAAHSKTHANMTALTNVQRAEGYGYPKSYLENLLGAGAVTTWAYPLGTGSGGRNLACDQHIYLRYDRWLDTAVGTNPVLYARYSDALPLLINRTTWRRRLRGHPTGWRKFTATNGVVDVVEDTPAANYQGTKALKLSTTDNTAYVPGRQYTLSGQCKLVSAGNAGNVIADKAFARIQSLDYGQAVIAGLDVKVTPVLGTDLGAGWKKFSLDFTAGQSTKTANVDLGLQAVVGGAEIRFDHVWFEPKYLGDLG